MSVGYCYPCKHLKELSMPQIEGICEVTNEWLYFKDTRDCPYRENRF